MKLTRPSSVIDIMENTLSHVDSRLVSHGKRVAYLMYRALEIQGTYTEEQKRDLCVLAMLHDIGAYKTEEIDKLVAFETEEVWDHSIYGYLFIKHFSPLENLAPIIFFHHADRASLAYLHPSYRELAQILFVADRIDVLAQLGMAEYDHFLRYFEENVALFDPALVDLFLTHDLYKHVSAYAIDEGFNRLLSQAAFTDAEVRAYLEMIVLSIDFRSTQTVAHTLTTSHISRMLGAMLGMDDTALERLYTGALLHDLGKTGIPMEILENPGRLTESEMSIMRQHVAITESILRGNVDDDTLNIAVRHHEKPNGKGYPRGLDDAWLSPGERIVAVADVFSALCGERSYKAAYSKEKTVAILQTMGREGQLDADMVQLAVGNYDALMQEVQKITAPVVKAYNKINAEYISLTRKTKSFHAKPGDKVPLLINQVCPCGR